MDNNAFYKYQENRAQSGYGAAILVKSRSATKYSLLIASETASSVFGSNNSFEFDLINSPVKGKVQGKMALEAKEVECLYHRDNAYRFFTLKDQTLDFLFINKEFVGYKFTGTIDFKPNDASADIHKGTYTITPMSADPNPIFNCRELVEETLCFGASIPEAIKSDEKIDLTLVQEVTATYTAFAIKNDGTKDNDTVVTVTKDSDQNSWSVSVPKNCLIGITASATGYAPWTTTVYVEKVSA
jgi:hypothetical protein